MSMVNIITSGQTYCRKHHKSNNNTRNRSNTISNIIQLQKLSHFNGNSIKFFYEKMALLRKREMIVRKIIPSGSKKVVQLPYVSTIVIFYFWLSEDFTSITNYSLASCIKKISNGSCYHPSYFWDLYSWISFSLRVWEYFHAIVCYCYVFQCNFYHEVSILDIETESNR